MRRQPFGSLSVSEEEEKAMIDAIQSWYFDEFSEEIGVLKASQILDMFLEKLGPTIYNKALDDANRWYKEHLDSLDIDFYENYLRNN